MSAPVPAALVASWPVVVMLLLLAGGSGAYKTYTLSTGENFSLDQFLRFEGALVARDEDEMEVRKKIVTGVGFEPTPPEGSRP